MSEHEIIGRLLAQLEKMSELSNMQATAHSRLRDHFGWWSSCLTIGGLVVSAALLSIVMIEPEFVSRTLGISPDCFRWVSGILALVNFTFTLVDLAWRPAAKASVHDHAVRHYTQAKYAIREVERDLHVNAEPTKLVEGVQMQYLDDRDLPKIPERWFLRLKRWHKIKVEISREIDLNPHQPIWLLRLELWWKDRKLRDARMEKNSIPRP